MQNNDDGLNRRINSHISSSIIKDSGTIKRDIYKSHHEL